ncbi:MAG: hypothetical protein M1274_02285 [Actinobacteria bacterium]|nr:hypothetical protein [Actinomycetota bacterium]
MDNTFLLPASVVEDDRFRACTTRERVFLLFILSEFALHGPFYSSDLMMAVTLGISVTKIREARRLFERQDWITVRTGFRVGGRNLATNYLGAPCSQIEPGALAAPVHRFAFEVLLDRVRQGQLLHADLLVYCILDYVRLVGIGEEELSFERDIFEISKERLHTLTALPGDLRSVRRLCRNFRFDDGSRLFVYKDHPDRLIITDWQEFADPSHCEEARQEREAMRADVAAKVRLRKELLGAQRRQPADQGGTTKNQDPQSRQAQAVGDR